MTRLQRARLPAVMARAARVAMVVGTAPTPSVMVQAGLTCLVPYGVSTHGQVCRAR
jgi:hypothetical protein